MRIFSLLIAMCLWGTSSRADTTEVSQPIQNLCGIGAILADKDGAPLIKELLPKGPADRAGLKVNDRIIQVDDKATQGLTLVDAVHLIRGPEGTEVKLTVERPTETSQFTVLVTREPIRVPDGHKTAPTVVP